MEAKEQKPPIIRHDAYCPNCSNITEQRFVSASHYVETLWSRDGVDAIQEPGATSVAVCETCLHLLVYEMPGEEYSHQQFHLASLSYPHLTWRHGAVPQAIQDAYEAASLLRAAMPAAYAEKVRQVVRAVCADRGAKGSSFQEELEDLASKGTIPASLADIAEEVMSIGPTATARQAMLIGEFFDLLVQHAYVMPNDLQDFVSHVHSCHKA
jgi:hypothetical protein